jgi:hypothetical protein
MLHYTADQIAAKVVDLARARGLVYNLRRPSQTDARILRAWTKRFRRYYPTDAAAREFAEAVLAAIKRKLLP